jgi:hypothetical protein
MIILIIMPSEIRNLPDDHETQSLVTLLVNKMACSGQSKSSGYYVNVLPGLE